MASPPFRGGQGGQHLDSQSSNTAQPTSISGRPQAAQLEFSQAMTDFKVMFPNMDAEVIEAVLRANNGAVDATIDHLLTMSADNEAEKAMHDQIDGETPKKGKIEHPPDYVGNPPSYQQATQEEDVDLINLGGACAAPLPKKTNLEGNDILADFSMVTGSQLQSNRDITRNQQQRTSVDLLSDLDLSGGAPQSSNDGISGMNSQTSANSSSLNSFNPSSSPRLAYSHPSRQAGTHEAMSVYPPGAASSSNIRDNSSSGVSPSMQRSESGASGTPHSSMIPTQQQLQEIYEENLRMREEAKSAFNHSPQALVGSSPGGQESQSVATQRQQFLEDERVALMLQNEEFMAELRRDHEFMSALESEESDASRAYAGHGDVNATEIGLSGQGLASSINRSKPTMMDEAVFREKLKNMGKTSKRKFSQMASIFSRRKGAKQLLGHAPAPSKDNLLLNAEPLVNDFDSDDDIGAGGAKTSGTDSSAPSRQPKTPTKGKYTSFS